MAEEFISGEEHNKIKNSNANKKTKVTVSVNHLVFIAVLVVACLISFWIGVAYQKHKNASNVATTTTTSGSSSGFPSRSGYSGRRMGGFGQVTSVSSTSISISNMRTGATTTYSINSNTVITDNGQTTSISDIQTGDTVIVTTSSSSSTVATRILVNPSFGGGGGGFSSGPSQSTTGSQTSN